MSIAIKFDPTTGLYKGADGTPINPSNLTGLPSNYTQTYNNYISGGGGNNAAPTSTGGGLNPNYINLFPDQPTLNSGGSPQTPSTGGGSPRPPAQRAPYYNDAPFYDAYGSFRSASDTIRGAASPESLDRAAARLRSRLDTRQRAAQQETTDQYASRGLAASGANDRAQRQLFSDSQSAYAEGLGSLENEFLNRQLQAGQALGDVGQGYGSVGQAQGALGIQAGGLGLQQAELDENRRTNRVNELLELLTTLGAVGNASVTDPNWLKLREYFSNIIGSAGQEPDYFSGFNNYPY